MIENFAEFLISVTWILRRNVSDSTRETIAYRPVSWNVKWTKELSLVFSRRLSCYGIVYRENKMFEFNIVCNHIVHVRSLYLSLRRKILNGQADVLTRQQNKLVSCSVCSNLTGQVFQDIEKYHFFPLLITLASSCSLANQSGSDQMLSGWNVNCRAI